MDTYIFPAIFEPSDAKGYCITFPDLPGCITEGDTLQEAMYMAKDALELFIYNLEEDDDDIPSPTNPEDIKVSSGTFVVPVEAYLPIVRSEMANKSVKKTLTVPYWLNKVAEEKKVNFSLVLQTSLKQYLGIEKPKN